MAYGTSSRDTRRYCKSENVGEYCKPIYDPEEIMADKGQVRLMLKTRAHTKRTEQVLETEEKRTFVKS